MALISSLRLKYYYLKAQQVYENKLTILVRQKRGLKHNLISVLSSGNLYLFILSCTMTQTAGILVLKLKYFLSCSVGFTPRQQQEKYIRKNH